MKVKSISYKQLSIVNELLKTLIQENPKIILINLLNSEQTNRVKPLVWKFILHQNKEIGKGCTNLYWGYIKNNL